MAFSQLLASIVLLGHLVENRPERCTTEGDLQQSLLQLENKGTHILQYWTGELWFELCGIDPEWNETAAVACRQLGFSDQGAEVTLTAELSTATLTAKLDQRCNGTETSLAECGVTVGDFQCTVGGITCQAATCDNSSVRLVDGYTNHDGRVEVCVDGQWGTVCNNNQEEIAETICSQLGFAVTGAEVISPIPTLSLPVHSCTVVNNYTLTCTSLIPDVSGSCNQLGILCKIKEEITKLCGMPTQENGTSIATTANPQPSTAGSQESGKTVAFQDDGTTTTTTRDAEAVNQSRMATNESNTTDSASSPMNLLEANTSTVDTSTRHGSEFTPMATLQGCNMTTITVLGAVIGVLVTLQTVTLIMWMVSCCINRRQKSSKLKPR